MTCRELVQLLIPLAIIYLVSLVIVAIWWPVLFWPVVFAPLACGLGGVIAWAKSEAQWATNKALYSLVEKQNEAAMKKESEAFRAALEQLAESTTAAQSPSN